MSSSPAELRIDRAGRPATVLTFRERLAFWLAFGACLMEALGGMLLPRLNHVPAGGAALAAIGLGPAFGFAACLLALGALRRGAADRSLAVFDAVLGALSLVGPWLILFALLASDAID